jgi:IS30 family transposase
MPALRSTEPRFRRGCPPEVDDRVMPGHWEGDFIKGAGNKSSVGVLVERSSRLVLLARMEDATAAAALAIRQAGG